MFPKNIFKTIAVDGKGIMQTEANLQLPNELKYVPISPSKRKEKKERKSPGISKKMRLPDPESSDEEVKQQVNYYRLSFVTLVAKCYLL